MNTTATPPRYNDPVKIGTTVHGKANAPSYIKQILPHGFESVAFTFGHMSFDHNLDLDRLGKEVREVCAPHGVTVGALGVYGNPVSEDAKGREVREGWIKLIDHAAAFGCDVVSGFSGAVDGAKMPESLKAVAQVFAPIAQRAADKGVRLAFENCPMGGTWHSAKHNSTTSAAAWEILFDLLPQPNVGLEWEPCHQMIELVDVLAQARTWAHKIFHIQGKCATIAHDVLRTYGRNGAKPWNWHRHPGFGDLNWSDLITILRQANWKGAIDIEGWHDPVYKGDLEMTGQVTSLNYLMRCKGGHYVPNPVA